MSVTIVRSILVTPHLHLHVTLMKVTLFLHETQDTTQQDAIKLMSDRGESAISAKAKTLLRYCDISRMVRL